MNGQAGAGKWQSAASAAALVREGDHVVLSGCGTVPLEFLGALAARTDLDRVYVHHASAWGELPHFAEAAAPHLRFEGYFLPAAARAAYERGDADYIPLTLSHVERLFCEGRLKADVVAVTGTYPDEHGLLSLGPFLCYFPAAMEGARVTIVETSRRFPWVDGAGVLPIDSFDVAIHCDRAPTPAADVKELPEAVAIAKHVATLIKDGSTLQVGRGSIANAVATQLTGRRDLGIHSEMISDWLIGMVETGAIRRTAKASGRRPILTSFIDGTQALFDLVDKNPNVEMQPIYTINSVESIAGEPGFVAINSAVEIDLMGQINAETGGGRLLGGSGGLLDFAIGTAFAQDGSFVIAIPSTAKGGRVSRIVPQLKADSVVTVPRSLAHYIVTEFGVCDVRGCTLAERARRLASVAHPRFREELLAAAAERQRTVS